MSTYVPDTWVVIKITNLESQKSHYRVFAEWYGGYTQGDSWKMNSGIESVELTEDNMLCFYGTSGSKYYCNQYEYRLRHYGEYALDWYRATGAGKLKIEVLDDQDWLNFEFKE